MLKTEQADPKYKGLDTWDNDRILTAFWQGQVNAVSSVGNAIPSLSKAADAIASRLREYNGRLIYAGAGSSGLLALQDGMEMPPTFGWPLSRLVLLMAGGDAARLLPTGIVEDDAEAGARDAEARKISSKDVLIAVAASGGTPYTVALAGAARDAGALVVGIANNADTALLGVAHYPVFLDSGPEVIAGSTRLGAGSAQKAALGMLSSLLMIRLGHVVDGYMVSVIADNAKLQARAIRMLHELTGAKKEEARKALSACGGDVKTAALLIRGHSAEAARALLSSTNGDLRQALAQPVTSPIPEHE